MNKATVMASLQTKTDLVFSVTRSSWSARPEHGTEWDRHPEMKKRRDAILRRDGGVCQACGWQSDRWQEIHHRDHDHRNYDEKNLETLCPLCHQVFHLPTASLLSGGTLIWLPQIPQAKLNLLCIALFVAMKDRANPWQTAARSLFGSLESKAAAMETLVGPQDPAALAQALLKMKPEEYAGRQKALQHIRLLPFASRFRAQVDYWEAAHFRTPPPPDWENLLPPSLDVAALLKERRQQAI